MSDKVKPLIVTTEHKGVFFGYGIPTKDNIIRLTDAQMCVYWSANVHGILGLAAGGPTKECKIGPPVPAITLQAITAVIEVSTDAEAKWKAQPWS